jgi:DNA (cytosine-5)-methyltransferase 1
LEITEKPLAPRSENAFLNNMKIKAANLPAISLFSGAGGMDVGFSAAGFQVVFANDFDADACATYQENHGDAVRHGSILDLLGQFKRDPEVAAVFGGPPCQGFSVAGKMDPGDSRSQLVWSFFETVERVRPKAFAMENVKALATISRWADVRSAIRRRALGLGYRAAIITLNASRFGVPQNRERMFMIGFREDIVGVESPFLGNELMACLLESERSAESVSEVVRRFGRAGSEGNPRICPAAVNFAKSPILRPSPYAGMLFNGAGRPMRSGGRACTLPASMGGNKTPIVDEGEIFDGQPSFVEGYHAHLRGGGAAYEGRAPERLRRLTIDECAAFQTFPENYRFLGRRNAIFRQIGNAVPCALAEAVAKVIAKVLCEGDEVLREAMSCGFPSGHGERSLFGELAVA